MNAEFGGPTPLDRARVFMGPTSADEGFSSNTHVIREIALVGHILPRGAYTTLVALYPIEGKYNVVTGYEARILSASQDTIPAFALAQRVSKLEIPPNANTHIRDSHLNQPDLRRQFELSAARLGQPSVVVAFGREQKEEHVGLFTIEGVRPGKALGLIQDHFIRLLKTRPAQNRTKRTPISVE